MPNKPPRQLAQKSQHFLSFIHTAYDFALSVYSETHRADEQLVAIYEAKVLLELAVGNAEDGNMAGAIEKLQKAHTVLVDSLSEAGQRPVLYYRENICLCAQLSGLTGAALATGSGSLQ